MMSVKEHVGCESRANISEVQGHPSARPEPPIILQWALDMDYLCERCGQIFKNRSSLLTHTRWKHQDPNSSHKCGVCKKIFITKQHLDRHQKNSGCKSSTNTAEVQGHPSAKLKAQGAISSSGKTYLCEKCGLSFQNKSSILSHDKWKHENPNSDLTCNMCQKTFSRRWRLDRHKQNCQDTKINKVCSICRYSAPTKAEIITHYEVNHGIHITKKTLNFNTIEEFKIWKEKFEKDTKSYFIKRTSTRRKKGGTSVSRYICHRDGYFQSKSKGIRRMKRIGSFKINSHCPASIIVSETDQNVKVVYVDAHIGHDLDLSHLNISKSEKAKIAEKIAMKIPFEQILNEIRNSAVSSKPDRIHLATRKDLWNIAASYNISQVQNSPAEVIYLEMEHSIDDGTSEAGGIKGECDNVGEEVDDEEKNENIGEEESDNIDEAVGDEEESENICEAVGDEEESGNICEAVDDEEEHKNICEAAGDEEETENICETVDEENENSYEAAGDEEESEINISEAVGDEEESAILRVINKEKQNSFDKRKQDMINKLLQICVTIENEEQLEAVSKQVAPLENIVNVLSKKDITISELSKKTSNKIFSTPIILSSTKKKTVLYL